MSKKMNLRRVEPETGTDSTAVGGAAERIKAWIAAGPGTETVADAVQNGVKTGQPTVSLQIRMLKAQADLLKTAAFVENRPASAILRQVLAEYFQRKCDDPDEAQREKWLQTLLATHYTEL